MKQQIVGALAMLACITTFAPPAPADVQPAPKAKVQIAILLDTSNSMDGLIEQAKTQLWRIVNEFATARKDGQIPDFEVALYQYGSPSLGEENGYVRQILPLTTDLDKVSEQLFALTTNGGDEYCGTVIGKSLEQLAWSPNSGDYKAIFIAGNEPFTQGNVNYKDSCSSAIALGIIVNTIHCGSEAEGINGSWKDGAMLADGTFLNIDQNTHTVHIDAPQDAEIEELGGKLNTTYIPWGESGEVAAANQVAQDANASRARRGAGVQRAYAKASAIYKTDWDLASAIKEGRVKLADVKDEDLPEEMRKLPADKRQDYIDQKLAEREAIQKQIAQLNIARATHVAEETKKLAGGAENTFDAAIIATVRSQAQGKNFEFKAPATQPASP